MRKLTNDEKLRIRQAIEDFSLTQELQTTEELHCFAARWNWDDYADPLFPIIRNPECDKGTALYLYWLSEPTEFFKRYEDEADLSAKVVGADYEIGYFRLIYEIQEKFLKGFYARETIDIDPADLADDCVNSNELKIKIPDVMWQPSRGEIFPQDSHLWYQEPEALPQHLAECVAQIPRDKIDDIQNLINSGQTFVAMQKIRQCSDGIENEEAYEIMKYLSGTRYQ